MKTPALLSLLLALSFAPAARADQVQFLGHGLQSFAGFSSVIDGAKTSVDLVTFTFLPCDTTGQTVVQALERAAKRGVKVRVLLDSMQHPASLLNQLANDFARYGIQLRVYNGNYFTTIGTNLRVHEKVLLADGQRYITGGRNVSDGYFGFGAASAEENWIDGDVLVNGASARQAQASFNDIWDGELNSATYQGNAAAAEPWAQFCGAGYAPMLQRAQDFLAASGPQTLATAPVRACGDVQFVYDHSDFGSQAYSGGDNDVNGDEYMGSMRLERKGTAKTMLAFLAGTRSRLDVINWFYAPFGKEAAAFAKLKDRHIPLTILTNQDIDEGPMLLRQAEEYAIAQTAARETGGTEKVLLVSSKGALADRNSFTPAGAAPFLIHSKMMVRDGRDALVGSYNLDPRSYNTNLEGYVVATNCPELAGDVMSEISYVQKTFEADLAARRIPPKEEPSAAAKALALMNFLFL